MAGGKGGQWLLFFIIWFYSSTSICYFWLTINKFKCLKIKFSNGLSCPPLYFFVVLLWQAGKFCDCIHLAGRELSLDRSGTSAPSGLISSPNINKSPRKNYTFLAHLHIKKVCQPQNGREGTSCSVWERREDVGREPAPQSTKEAGVGERKWGGEGSPSKMAPSSIFTNQLTCLNPLPPTSAKRFS